MALTGNDGRVRAYVFSILRKMLMDNGDPSTRCLLVMALHNESFFISSLSDFIFHSKGENFSV
jgi:hypothetical protein